MYDSLPKTDSQRLACLIPGWRNHACNAIFHNDECSLPKVDLTPRLAHESKPQEKDTILFDKKLPSFELRIHPSGRKTVWVYLKARILPVFGRMPLDCIGPEDVAAWFDAASRERPGVDNRVFKILLAMMSRAEEWGLRERDTNPCLGIFNNPRRKIARFFDTDVLARLGCALDKQKAEWPEAVAAIRLLALTDCRLGEVLNLRWRDVSDEALQIPDSKTGSRAVLLGRAARAIVDALPGERYPDKFLFLAYASRRGYYPLRDCWRAVCKDAYPGSLRLHDLRHTMASHAVMSGENLPLVGRLLGHRQHCTTTGYAHLADVHLVEAAKKVGSIIAVAMMCTQSRQSHLLMSFPFESLQRVPTALNYWRVIAYQI